MVKEPKPGHKDYQHTFHIRSVDHKYKGVDICPKLDEEGICKHHIDGKQYACTGLGYSNCPLILREKLGLALS